MKKLSVLLFAFTLSGCNGCATAPRSATRAELRQTIADTNVALTNASNQRDGYQKAAQKYARLYYNLKRKKS